MYCENCGFPLKEGDLFCESCGAIVGKVKKKTTKKTTTKKVAKADSEPKEERKTAKKTATKTKAEDKETTAKEKKTTKKATATKTAAAKKPTAKTTAKTKETKATTKKATTKKTDKKEEEEKPKKTTKRATKKKEEEPKKTTTKKTTTIRKKKETEEVETSEAVKVAQLISQQEEPKENPFAQDPISEVNHDAEIESFSNELYATYGDVSENHDTGEIVFPDTGTIFKPTTRTGEDYGTYEDYDNNVNSPVDEYNTVANDLEMVSDENYASQLEQLKEDVAKDSDSDYVDPKEYSSEEEQYHIKEPKIKYSKPRKRGGLSTFLLMVIIVLVIVGAAYAVKKFVLDGDGTKVIKETKTANQVISENQTTAGEKITFNNFVFTIPEGMRAYKEKVGDTNRTTLALEDEDEKWTASAGVWTGSYNTYLENRVTLKSNYEAQGMTTSSSFTEKVVDDIKIMVLEGSIGENNEMFVFVGLNDNYTMWLEVKFGDEEVNYSMLDGIAELVSTAKLADSQYSIDSDQMLEGVNVTTENKTDDKKDNKSENKTDSKSENKTDSKTNNTTKRK